MVGVSFTGALKRVRWTIILGCSAPLQLLLPRTGRTERIDLAGVAKPAAPRILWLSPVGQALHGRRRILKCGRCAAHLMLQPLLLMFQELHQLGSYIFLFWNVV